MDKTEEIYQREYRNRPLFRDHLLELHRKNKARLLKENEAKKIKTEKIDKELEKNKDFLMKNFNFDN